ncbi:MAG: class I SAM-dependent methyltransferase, partial [Pseudomonadota bacterium]
MLSRGTRRTLSFGLQTVLGIRQKGYFIPSRTAPAAAAWSQRPYKALTQTFDAARQRFADHLALIDGFNEDLAVLDGPPPEPRFDQTWFPRLDAAALYALVRHHAPHRIVEVGSGHSTRFIARAIRDGGFASEMTAIDPQPRADIEGLPITLIKTTLQAAGLGPFEALKGGDILMVDSSHILMPGSDVDLVLNHVIPALPAGVIVGFHDVFLPDPYPPAWPFNVYNEQNGVAPLIGGRAELVFSSAYVVAH